MDVTEVVQATKFIDWSELLDAADGTTFPIVINGEVVTATKVHSDGQEHDYDENDLFVVIEVQGRYFRKNGWGVNGSHCYGDYTPSWESSLNEVSPATKTVTVWG